MDASKSNVRARNRQRYHFIRYQAELQGMRIRDLHARFNEAAALSRQPTISSAAFYRVAAGTTKSERVRRFLSKSIKHPHQELWS